MPREPMLAIMRSVVEEAARSGNRGLEAVGRRELARALEVGEDWEAAYREFDRSAELWLLVNEPADEASALFASSRSLFRLRRLDEAASRLQRAAHAYLLAEDIASWRMMAEAARDLLVELEQWPAVLSWLNEIVAVTSPQTDEESTRLRVKAHSDAVAVAIRLEDWEATVDHARQGITLAERLDPAVSARLGIMAGFALNELGRGSEALPMIELGVERADKLGLDDLRAIGVTLLVSITKERPALRAQRFEALSARSAASGNDRWAAMYRYRQGSSLALVRPLDEDAAADVLMDAADDLEAAGLVSEAAHACSEAADVLVYSSFRSPARAARSLEAALRASRLAVETRNWLLAGLAEHTAAYASRPLEIGARSAETASHFRRAARFLRRAGRYEEATGAWTAALGQWTSDAGTLRALRQARMLLRTFELGRRVAILPKVLRRQEGTSSVGLLIGAGVAVQAALVAGLTPPWERLLWEFEEAAKARVMQDELLAGAWDRATALSETLRAAARQAEMTEARLNRLDEALELILAGRPDPANAEAAMQERDEAKLANAEADLALERLIASDWVRTDGAGQAPPITPEDMAAVLNPGEIYLGFLSPAVGSRLIRVKVAAAAAPEVDLIDEPRLKALQRLADHLGTCDPEDRDHDDITHRSLEPVWDLIVGHVPSDANTVMVSPHGHLANLPWSLAVDRFGARRVGVLTPSAGVFKILRQRAKVIPELTYLGVGSDSDGCIPGVEIEVENIRQRYFSAMPHEVWLTAESEALVDEARSTRILHLACHAARTGLLIGPPGHATWVLPSQLAASRLRAEILILTGCHAGFTAYDDTSEYLGVLRELIQATGARAAVASRDAVPDAAGIVFADLLMTALTGSSPGPWGAPTMPLPLGAAVAWASARLKTLDPNAAASLVTDPRMAVQPYDPTWWSPWLVIGDPAVTLDTPEHFAARR